jgi:hypothetical protein
MTATAKNKSIFYDLQEPTSDDLNYIGESAEEQLKARSSDLYSDGVLSVDHFKISDAMYNLQTGILTVNVLAGVAYINGRRIEILSDDTTTYNELNPAKNLLNGECPKSTGCRNIQIPVTVPSGQTRYITLFLLYAKDYDENIYIIDPETYKKRYTRERAGYAIGYKVDTVRSTIPSQLESGGIWKDFEESDTNPNWTVSSSYIILGDLVLTNSSGQYSLTLDRSRLQISYVKGETLLAGEITKHQTIYHTNGISSLTETNFKYYKYAVKDLLGEGEFRTVSETDPLVLEYTPFTTTEVYIRIAVNVSGQNQDLTIAIYNPDNELIDSRTFTFSTPIGPATVTYTYTSTDPVTVGKVRITSTTTGITVNYDQSTDTPKTHTIYRDTTDTDTYDEYLPFAIPQLDNNGINQSDCIMIRDTLTENKSFIYVNGKRITRFLFRGIELSSVQWVDNKKYFVLKNLTQTDFGGQTGTFYLVVDENGSIGFSTSLDPLKLTLAVLNVQYSINNTWLPSNVGGLSIELQKDTRYLVDSHKKLRLSEYPIEIVPTNDQSSQTPEIVLSANTTSFANVPYLPLRIRIENDGGKSKLVFEGSTGNNILTILDNGKIGIGTTSPNKTLSIIDSGVGIDRPDTNTLSFYTNNTERLRIDPSGNVGIGTGTSPLSQKLVVAGDIGLKTNTDAFIGTLDTFGLSLRTNNTDRIYITNEGNVGIGTTTPSERLEVNGNIKGTNLISTSLTSGSILFADSGGLISQDNDNLFWDNTNKKLGIGTTNPIGKLDIEGRKKVYTLTRTQPTSVNNYVEIGYISGSNFIAKISIYSSGGYLISSKFYQIATDYQTSQGWKIVNPIFSSPSMANNNDFSLDANWSSTYGPLYLRIRMTSIGTNPPNGNFVIVLEIDGPGSFTETTGTGSTTAPTDFFDSSILTQRNGNVGIGTTSPPDKLTVSGGNIQVTGAGCDSVWRPGTASPNAGLITFGDGTGWKFHFGKNSDNGATKFMTIQDNGNVGIGTTSPGYLLDVNGSAHASSFPTSSDIRFKTDVKPINDALNIVMNLQGVRFKWNDFYKNTLGVDCDTEKYEFGVIAQETENVAPEVITKFKRQYKEKTKDGEEVDKEEEFLSVDYGRLVAVLIEAIKEQQKQIEELKQEIAGVKK